MRSYVRTFKCENVSVRSVRNEDCESGYVRSRPYIPICEPEGRDRVEKENQLLTFFLPSTVYSITDLNSEPKTETSVSGVPCLLHIIFMLNF